MSKTMHLVTKAQAEFEIARRRFNKTVPRDSVQRIKFDSTSGAVNLTGAQLAAIVTTVASTPKVVASKSAPKVTAPKAKAVATLPVEVPTAGPAKRGPKPLNGPELTKLRDELFDAYQATWRTPDADGITGKEHYNRSCDDNRIVTRRNKGIFPADLPAEVMA